MWPVDSRCQAGGISVRLVDNDVSESPNLFMNSADSLLYRNTVGS